MIQIAEGYTDLKLWKKRLVSKLELQNQYQEEKGLNVASLIGTQRINEKHVGER